MTEQTLKKLFEVISSFGKKNVWWKWSSWITEKIWIAYFNTLIIFSQLFAFFWNISVKWFSPENFFFWDLTNLFSISFDLFIHLTNSDRHLYFFLFKNASQFQILNVLSSLNRKELSNSFCWVFKICANKRSTVWIWIHSWSCSNYWLQRIRLSLIFLIMNSLLIHPGYLSR